VAHAAPRSYDSLPPPAEDESFGNKCKAGEREKIVIIDLLNFEDGVTSVGIPGAIRIDPIRLRGRSRLVIPRELELILSCSSVGEIRRARVALALRRKAIPKVWILEGGLKAWIKEDYPVTSSLSDPKEREVSLGVQVLD
jgi:rhodanese-related sulfurtransferase